jgi:hypothetical protein
MEIRLWKTKTALFQKTKIFLSDKLKLNFAKQNG